MGNYDKLAVKCKVLPEFSEFIRKEYLRTLVVRWGDDHEAVQKEYDGLSKSYRDLIDIWRDLGIEDSFHEYKFDDNGVFSCKISKKFNRYDGDLRKAYETFIKDIIVPISSEIWDCYTVSEIFGNSKTVYTDLELRGGYFRLDEKIKYVEHTYSEDGSEILESRVVYKRSIKKSQEMDLNRAYNGLGR